MSIPPIRIVIAGVDKFSATLGKSLQSIGKIGKKVASAGRIMTMAVTLPVLAMGASTLKTAADFETSMNRVQNLTSATGSELVQMQNQARDLGATTMFTASQAADAMGFLGMAGFETNEIISAMPATLNLAAASQMELAQTADLVSNVLTGYNTDATKTGMVTDVLVSTFQNANTNLEQLGDAMRYVAPIAASMKIPIRDTATAIGLLGNAGMQGSMAGVQLRGILASLSKPSAEAASALEKLGIPRNKILDASGNVTSLRGVIEQLSKAGATSTDLFTIFGRRMGPGMAALISQGVGEFDKLREKLDDQGSSQRAAEVSMKGLNGQLKALKSAWEDFQLSIADSGILETVTKLVTKFAAFFRRISKVNPQILKMGVIFAGIMAVVGPLLFIIGNLMSAFSAIGGAIASAGGIIALVSNPIGWVIAAILGLIAMIMLLKRAGLSWAEAFRVVFASCFPLVAVVEFIIENWKRLLPFFKLALMGIVGLFKVFGKVIMFLLKPVLWILDKLIEPLKWIMDKGLRGIEWLANKVLSPELKSKIGFVGVGGEAPAGGALALQSSIEERNIKQESKLKVEFSNIPDGTRLKKEGRGPFDFEAESGSLLPAMGG